MKLALQVLLTTVVATAALAGCGGSDGPETVNGCVIEPSTSCASVDLSGADLSGADLSRATLSGANLEDTDLSDSNLTEANLSSAQIVGTDLSGADLTSANLTGATITGANLDGATLCGTTRTDGTVDDTSCPATTDTSTTETTETTTTAVSDAELTSLDVGDLDCGAATTGPVTVSWETSNATAVEISVDGLSPAGFGPSGSTTVVVPCDGESHQITVTPQSDAGPGQAESEEVSAQLGLQPREDGDSDDDRRHSDDLNSPQPLLEEDVRRDGRDCGELRRKDGGDRDPVTGPDGEGREADDLGDPGRHDERKRRPRQGESRAEREWQRHDEDSQQPRRRYRPRNRELFARPTRRVDAHGERARRGERVHRHAPRRPPVHDVDFAVARDRCEHDAHGDRGQHDARPFCDVLAGQDCDHGRDRALGGDDRCHDPDLPDAKGRIREQEADDVPGPGENEKGDRALVEPVRPALERRPRHDDAEPGEEHPREHGRRADHARCSRRGERRHGERDGCTEPAQDRDHRTAVTERLGTSPRFARLER